MQKMSQKSLCLLLCSLLFLFGSPIALAREYSGVSRDYSVTGLSSTEVRARTFTVHAAFAYYGVSSRSSYQEGGNFYDCSSCGGTGYRTCSACAGEGGKGKLGYVPCQLANGYSEPYCQRSCDGNDYLCDPSLGGCGHRQRSPHGKHQYCAHQGRGYWIPYWDCDCETDFQDEVWVECRTCGGEGQRECTRCHGNGWYETGGHMVTTYPSDPLPEKVTVDFLLDGAVVSTGPVTLAVHTETHSGDASWEKWAGVDAEATITAAVGTHEVQARINWDRKDYEMNRSNNMKALSVEVRPVIDLDADFVDPGAGYRAGTEVISTFKVYNRDPEGNGLDITPAAGLRVDFQAANPATGALLASQTRSAVIIPEGGSNIVYFKWRAPADYSPGTVSLRLHVNPDGAVDETDSGNNVVAVSHPVARPRDSDTPDTQFEERAPSGWYRPSDAESLSTSGILTSAPRRSGTSWQEWGWDAENEAFVLNTFGVRLAPGLTVEPDERALSRKWLAGQGAWRMGSGYGLTLQATGAMQAAGVLPPASAYTNAQSAQAHYPEFQYSNGVGKFSLLDLTAVGKFELKFNVNSTAGTGASDPRRLHFTPLWYPDGAYTVRTLLYDCWTPAGMLVAEGTDALQISGSIYDDHYVNHRD